MYLPSNQYYTLCIHDTWYRVSGIPDYVQIEIRFWQICTAGQKKGTPDLRGGYFKVYTTAKKYGTSINSQMQQCDLAKSMEP